MLDDTPHRIALGMAIGIFIAWTPTVGVQMMLAIPLAYLLRANRLASVIGVHLSNPITLLPVYWLDYYLGAMLLGNPLTFEEFREILMSDDWARCWRGLLSVGIELAGAIWLGGLILGACFGGLGYLGTHWFVRRLRYPVFESLTSSHHPVVPAGKAIDFPVTVRSLEAKRNEKCRASETG
jgi:uncharacterized protein